jgi:hypothetical protein
MHIIILVASSTHYSSAFHVLTSNFRFSKYFRLIVNCIAYWSYKPVPLSDDPLFTPEDVTVVIPSLDGDTEELRETVRSVLKTDPHEVMLVTIDENVEKAERMAQLISPKSIKVLSIPKANKRHQMCRALPCITTPITIFADDDVSWPSTLLPWMLAPFKDPKMGGVGTNQRLRREESPNIWNFLGAAYLIRRNWDCTACCHIDGGLPCLSGRTVAYRTHILQDSEFQYSFQNEMWRSCQLNADDDNFLTRWMVNHEWKTWIQFHKDCEVQTTLEDNMKYLKQCNRWARSNWRSNFTTLFVERTAWRYVHLNMPITCSSCIISIPADNGSLSKQVQFANDCDIQTTSLEHFCGISNDFDALVIPSRCVDVVVVLAAFHRMESEDTDHISSFLGPLGGLALQACQILCSFLPISSGPQIRATDSVVWLFPFLCDQDLCTGHNACGECNP